MLFLIRYFNLKQFHNSTGADMQPGTAVLRICANIKLLTYSTPISHQPFAGADMQPGYRSVAYLCKHKTTYLFNTNISSIPLPVLPSNINSPFHYSLPVSASYYSPSRYNNCLV
jgi:hypothetical protein